jgi:hypothetical protein
MAAPPASAAIDRPVAVWQMNEAAGSTTMVDSSVTMSIDGQRTGRNTNPTGTIANTRPLTIAGKGNCDQVEITCDYFSGDIDYVRIETS